MNRNHRHARIAAFLAAVLSFAVLTTACSNDTDTSSNATVTASPATSQATTGTANDQAPAVLPEGSADPFVNQVTSPVATSISAEDIENLVWMREEEKLAHDVYVALFDLWQVPVFDNISQAETAHTEAVKSLLDSYGIEDPAVGNDPGIFTNPDIQTLYDDLVAQGSRSLVDALEVGAYIEEMDILDLRERESTVADIDRVYDNLERGSRNHLRAFIGNLERRGVTYTPSLMTVDEYEDITSTSTETGSDQQAMGNDQGQRGAGQGNRRGRVDS